MAQFFFNDGLEERLLVVWVTFFDLDCVWMLKIYNLFDGYAISDLF